MHRSSIGQASRNHGAHSPYLFSSEPIQNLSDHYQYVDEADYRTPIDDPSDPDVIHIRYRHETWPITFPAFSLAEERVLVRHVRDNVAVRLLGHERESARIKLIYKDVDIRHNDRPLRHYGPKQDSEIVAVITQHPRNYNRPHYSESEGESGSGSGSRQQYVLPNGGPRDRHNSTVRRQPSTRHEDSRRSTAGMLHPSHAEDSFRDDHSSRHSSVANHSRAPSPARPSHTNSPRTSASQLATPPAPPPNIDSRTPQGKIALITHEFSTKWTPIVDDFLSAPGDAENQEKQYLMLTEMISQRVFDQGDQIVTDDLSGRDKDEVKAARKELYARAADLQKRLDVYKPRRPLTGT